jgi:hypothetical protein
VQLCAQPDRRGKGGVMAYQYGGLFRAYCSDDGKLDADLIRKVFKRDAELNAKERQFWRLHNPEDFSSLN